jgi:hypothetical protein
VVQNRISANTHRELVLALQSAKTRLSIAIAVETKCIPRDRWLYCLDVADQIRRLIKKVRGADFLLLPNAHVWILSLKRLECLSVQGQAMHLSEIVRDIVTAIE